MTSVEEMEQSLNEISSLTRELREVIYPRFGNESLKNVKKLILLDITVCNIAKLNSLTNDILFKMNKLDEVLNCENSEVLKNTEIFKIIMMDEQLYTDILYNCTYFGMVGNIDEIKYNLVKLIHKNFQDFVFKISSKYTMNNFEKRLNTIRFFCDNGLINKINGLSYFNHYISYYIYYEQCLYLWNRYLKYQMTSAEEALNAIHMKLSIETKNKRFQTYLSLVNSVKELFPNFSVNLILRVEKDSDKDELNYLYARNMLKNIILSGQYENIKFLLEFEDFKSNYSLMIFDIIFSSDGGILNSKYYSNNKLKSNECGNLFFDRSLCIKLIINLISILDLNFNLNPELLDENKVLIIDRIKKGIILFVGKISKMKNNIECFELIDLLITRGICKMEDTHGAFKNSSLAKRRTMDAFLSGYYKLVDDGSVPHIDPNMFSSFLKSFVE